MAQKKKTGPLLWTSVPCPQCGALVGEPCGRTSPVDAIAVQGLPVKRTHDARMKALCPHVLFRRWRRFSAEHIDAMLEWNQRRSEGWLRYSELLRRLGLDANGPSLAAVKTVTECLSTRVSDLPDLCRPITIQELVHRGELVNFIQAAFSNGSGFILQCMTMDDARAMAVAHTLSGK